MYTVIVEFDGLTEVYHMTEYNQEIKDAIEYLNTYGEDSVVFVSKGEVVEVSYEVFTLELMIKRFEDSEFFEAYCDESEKEMMEEYKTLLRRINIK
ncbi:hypothetical protein [Niallia circulans]|uniref:hypothetical protein n=1 Tax=Niallia circulans TaxID=1397 RepID=UPI0026F141FE|nr:hypothetical protein [Niallia circulans]